MQINGSVAVVTGASGGIGRATAHALAERGCQVVVTSRRAESLDDVVRECEERGAEALAVPADVTDADALDSVARAADEHFGALDIWVNNAAVTAFGPIEEVPLDVQRRVLEVNVFGYLHGARAALPYLRERPQGALVNVSSVVGVATQPYAGAYVMSKFADRALSGVLRQELRLRDAKHVKVCSVLPAAIDTPLFAQAANFTRHRVTPLKPVYRPQRVARSIVRAIQVPRGELVSGTAGHSLALFARLLRMPTERLMALMVRRQHFSDDQATEPSRGNLFEPAPESGSVDGGWRS
ncbi:SDR family NAD(P)-dependent oxidoreductase [Streptomyces sp. OF3]|uniref:SDR family NAD(P)-dependent oxidoreductase n=1 Tax=Streptomyces alkaliterrae TaxID=2213162 RepID=A0A7W3WPQ7_9ACTN|nr:SDR family NAD(P)-dependent oxidoreductase [Streptomyces alkaliterrae]MBB1256169.1 SDR family NAD(P)-dependent oxidoreductase [Streptomyces alkaliterrae]